MARMRVAVVASGLLVVVAVVAIGGWRPQEPSPAAAQGSFDWKRHTGKQIRFLVNSHYWTNEIVRPAIPEFEKLTGIKVSWEVFPEDQFRQKLAVELVAGSGSVDGFMSLTSWDGLRFKKAGWYEPIDRYVGNPALTNAQFAFDDFFPNTRQIATVGGALIGIPLYPEVQLLYYRKDLFQEKGIKVPETMEEFEAAAKKLTDKANNFYGYVSRGKRSAAVYTLAPFIFNQGGHWLDKDNQPLLTAPAALKGLDTYGRMLREYGPPGAVNVHVYEVWDLMSQGRVAMATDSSNGVSVLEDPKKSQVAGKIGYTRIPRGPAGSHTPVISWAISIAAQSKNKEAAWHFIQWAASKEMVQRQAKAKVPVARKSVWESPDFQNSLPRGWIDSFQGALADGYPNQANPVVVAVPETRDAIGAAIVAAIEGQDVRAAAERAQKTVAEIIKKTQ
jgi:multiple sugar transport system substrate-binding protein